MKKILFFLSMPLIMQAQAQVGLHLFTQKLDPSSKTPTLEYRGDYVNIGDTIVNVPTHLILYIADELAYSSNNVSFSTNSNLGLGEQRLIRNKAIKSHFCYSEKEVLNWLNIIDFGYKEDRKNIRIEQSNLIGIYDLRTAKKVELVLKTEYKEVKEKTIIEKKTWIDKFFEKKK